MKDILSLDNMITPKIITIIYWLFLGTAVGGGLNAIFNSYGGFTLGNLFTGLFYMVAGIVAARIWCELLIVLFKMNEALQDIRNK